MNFMNTDAQLRLAFFAFQVEAYKAESDSDQIVTFFLRSLALSVPIYRNL